MQRIPDLQESAFNLRRCPNQASEPLKPKRTPSERRAKRLRYHEMSHSLRSAPKLYDDIRRVLDLSMTECCSILFRRIDEEQEEEYRTYRRSTSGKVELIPNDDGTIVYGIGSVTKLIIALALHLIVDIYRTSDRPEHGRYHRLLGWEQQYVEALNSLSSHTVIDPLPGNPTIQQLLIHHNGLPNVNHFTLAPTAAPLMSKEEFLKIAPHLSKSAARGPDGTSWVEYSNGNCILIGILIEAVSGVSLGEFLRKELLEPLELDQTYADAEALRRLSPSSRAFPHVINSHGGLEAIDDPDSMSDAVEIGTLGIYSCARDLGRLFEAILPSFGEDPAYKLLSEESVSHLFGYDRTRNRVSMSDKDGQKWVPAGMVTAMGTPGFGSRSINYLVSRGDEIKGNKDELIYQAGSKSSYSCSCYIIRKSNEVVVVLSNTLGKGDAADYVARLMVEERESAGTRSLSPSRLFQSRAGTVVAKTIQSESQNFSLLWQQAWTAHNATDDPTIFGAGKLTGLYKEEQFLQSLRVTADNDQLYVEVVTDSKRSEKIRLARTAKGKLKMCPKRPGIDLFFAWKNLDLSYESGGNGDRVTRLSNTTVLGKTECVLNYVRQPET